MRKRLRIVVCHRRRAVREALGGYLQLQPEVAAVDLAADADEAVRLARRNVDVVVLDLGDDGSPGLEALEALRNLQLDVPALVLSAGDNIDHVARALGLGALGYCRQDIRQDEFRDAVLTVASGAAVVPDSAVGDILTRLRADQRMAEAATATLHTLTNRERELLRMLANGVPRAEIARRLGLSPHTVRTHLRHAMTKMGVRSQLAAAARARELFEAAANGPHEPRRPT